MDFLDASNVAGQTLLRLASRGNAIIAELVRLSEHIPGIFKLDDKAVQKKYADIILDFNYVGRADSYENKIENNPDLLELDSEVKETYLELLKRFYLLFESIYKYITDFLRYIEEVESGNTMQSLEAVVMDETGKQLMAEVIYLYGVMLLLVDELIEGPVRERMLISYLRYMGQNELSLIDEVCKLMARTTRTPSNPRPQGYPEDLFARIKLPSSLLAMILGRLRSDDLYNQQAAYPLPEHRSFALALQAQLLYVLLYFTPHVLRDEFAVMREIVDKHFPDNWVITYYLGFTADLTLVWDNYKAAKQALAQTIQANNVTALKNKCWTRVPTLLTTLGNLLREGVLTEQFILENRSSLLATLRECNVTLRWLMLHSRSVNKKLREQVIQGGNGQQLLVLLMNTAQFEFILKREFQALIDAKQERWEDCKKESSSRVKELSDFFSGEKPLSNIKKSERFQKWFGDIANTIQSLDYNEVAVAGRKLQQLMSALEEVEQFEQIETNLQVKQFLAETRKYLQRMVRIGHMTEKVMGTFDIITDIAYAWELIDDYVASMQALIKRDPANVIKLRAIFVKLSSILMVPLVRINQANSPDLASVSQYYTEKLEAFVRRVLEVIPASMFDLLRVIIDLQINKLKELPTRVEKDKLKEFAQLEQRTELAKATHQIAVFTQGMIAMEKTLVGIKLLDPRVLLEEGIRKQLVLTISRALHNTLAFPQHRIEEFEVKLKALGNILDGFRRSFTYIQDYVNIYGLKIWQEEFSRIVNFNVEQESNQFVKRKIMDWQSEFQSEAVPIPRFNPLDDGSLNFMGRICQELLLHSNCTTTTYLNQMSAWFDRDGRELIGMKTFALLMRSVEVFGVIGIDLLMSFMIARDLVQLLNKIRLFLKQGNAAQALAQSVRQLKPTTAVPEGADKTYMQSLKTTAKLWSFVPELISKIGQKQLIRRQIANLLNFTCKLDSNILYSALEVMNKSLLTDVQAHYRNPDVKPYPSDDNPLLFELSKYLEHIGINDPFAKIYITTDPLENFAFMIFLLIISQLPKWTYNEHLSVLMGKAKNTIDSTPFIVGVITLLKQFHSLNTQKVLAYLGQYVRSLINATQERENKMTEMPAEVYNVLLFLDEFLKFSSLDRSVMSSYLPEYIFDTKK